MPTSLQLFERISRRAFQFTDTESTVGAGSHPFDDRNVHPDFPNLTRDLFDNGHYPQASLEAFKFVDEEVQRISGRTDYGTKLMMQVFGSASPVLALNKLATKSEKSEQEGYKHLFAGGMQGIRNPRAHSTTIVDDPDTCLDHLCFASMLLRRLEQAGLR